MKKNIISLLILIITLMAGVVFFAGCSTEDTLTPSEFAPPTNFRALAQSGSVILSWTRSIDDPSSSFTGYRVMAFEGTIKIESLMTTNNTVTITTAMVNGHSYKFKIWSVKSNDDVSVADSITWGPTERYSTVKIFEFDSDSVSGLQFNGSNRLSFTSGPPKGDHTGQIDLWVDGRDTTDLLIKSPSDENFTSSGWRTTKLYETSATGLDQPVSFPDISAFRTSPGYAIGSGKVFLAVTQDGNYARFLVSSPGVQGSYPDRFIQITIAYNSTAGNPWAKK